MQQPRLGDALRAIARDARQDTDARLASDSRSQRLWVVNPRGEVGLRTVVQVNTESPFGAWQLTFKPDGSLDERTSLTLHATGTVYAEYPGLSASNQPLLHLESDSQLDGRYARPKQGDNPRARPAGGDWHFAPEPPDPRGAHRRTNLRVFDPDFLEVQAYYHVTRAHELVRAYGSDLADYPIPIDVLDAGGSNNACYQPTTRSLHFFSLSRFHPAADNSVIYHEYGHAIFHALQREDYREPETSALHEGFADFVACCLTGSSQVGQHFFAASRQPVRELANGFTIRDKESAFSPHEKGLVLGGLGWDITRELGTDGARTLLFGAAQLAPRPSHYRAMAVGLMLSDLFFFQGRNRDFLRRQLSRRGLDL
jgi:hypothetical protein